MNKKQEAILKLQIKIRLLESDSVRIREWKKAERIKWNEMMGEIMSFCRKPEVSE